MFSEKIENVYIFLKQKPEYLIIIFQTVFRFLPGSFLCRQSENASRTISRVLSGMIICLGRLLPAASSDLPKASGPHHCFCSVLLRMGFTYALSVTRKAVVSTRSYPASCPMKPGLSSPAAFRHMQLRSFILLAFPLLFKHNLQKM